MRLRSRLLAATEALTPSETALVDASDLQKSEMLETSTEPLEFVVQGDRVLVVGFASGRIIATNKTFKDNWVFAITVRNGKLTNIREYIDTQALARASEMSLDNEEIIR